MTRGKLRNDFWFPAVPTLTVHHESCLIAFCPVRKETFLDIYFLWCEFRDHCTAPHLWNLSCLLYYIIPASLHGSYSCHVGLNLNCNLLDYGVFTTPVYYKHWPSAQLGSIKPCYHVVIRWHGEPSNRCVIPSEDYVSVASPSYVSVLSWWPAVTGLCVSIHRTRLPNVASGLLPSCWAGLKWFRRFIQGSQSIYFYR